MQQIERKARLEANTLWFAYLSEKNPVKASKILKQRDEKMKQVHRIVANMLLAQYGYCPISYASYIAKKESQQKTTRPAIGLYLYRNNHSYA